MNDDIDAQLASALEIDSWTGQPEYRLLGCTSFGDYTKRVHDLSERDAYRRLSVYRLRQAGLITDEEIADIRPTKSRQLGSLLNLGLISRSNCSIWKEIAGHSSSKALAGLIAEARIQFQTGSESGFAEWLEKRARDVCETYQLRVADKNNRRYWKGGLSPERIRELEVELEELEDCSDVPM